MRKPLLLLLVLFTTIASTIAQNTTNDELFHQAREMAFSKDYSEAISLLLTLQQSEPENTDYSIFLARVYSWNKEYEKAFLTLNEILTKDSFPLEAVEVMVTTQLWAENFPEAVKYSNLGIEIFNDPIFKISKAKALIALNKPEDAKQLIDELPEAIRKEPAVLALYTQIIQKARHTIAASYTNTSFSSPADGPWHSAWMYYKTTLREIPILGKYHFGSIGERTGSQIDLEAYPRAGRSGYFYLNAGMGIANEVFPDFKFGAEYYQALNENFELSGGSRLLLFDRKNVYIFTGHLGYRFLPNIQINYRPYAALSEENWSLTHTAAISFSNPLKETIWILNLQYGSIPYEYITATSFSNLETFRAGIEHQWRVSDHILLKPVFLYENEEFLPSEYKNRFNVQLISTFRF